MSNRAAVVPLRAAPDQHGSGLLAALDELEAAAADAGVLYVDVALALALARHLASVVTSITLGSEPTIAQVHAIHELRLAFSEVRQLVVDHARARR